MDGKKTRTPIYIFTKKHENKKEVFQENYLEQFILENNNLDTFLKNTNK
jgi:hypothetical protein